MSGPVNWAVYDGEFLEEVMAVLVAQDHPNVVKRTPASGDGGIDLMIPDAPDAWEIEQIKGFHQRIGSSEEKQIEKSWKSLRKDPRLPKRKDRIVEYRLVVATNPTPKEQNWFEELVAEAADDFPCLLRGKVHWDSLASKHPHVIDYYMNGGRERIAQRAEALLAAGSDPRKPITPVDVAAGLDMLRSRLSKDSPFYQYEFMTTASQPTETEIGECALARISQMSDGGWLTIKVMPKHSLALEYDPIKLTGQVQFADVSAAAKFREDLEGFRKFGRRLEIPDGSLFATLHAPGGLGGTLAGASARIGPAVAEGQLDRMRLVVVDESETPVAEVYLNTTLRTAGELGGSEHHLADASGSLTATLRVEPADAENERLAFSITVAELTGKPVSTVAAVAMLAGHLTPEHELRLMLEYGTQVIARHRPTTDRSLLNRGFALHIDDLAYIQDRAAEVIIVPAEMESDFARELHESVWLMRGEVGSGTWTEVTVVLKPELDRSYLTDDARRVGACAIEEPRGVTIDGQEIELGLFTAHLKTAVVADDQTDLDERSVRLMPGTDDTFTIRAGSVASLTAQPPAA